MKTSFVLFLFLCALQIKAQEESLLLSFQIDEIPTIELSVEDIKEIAFVEDNNPLDIEGEWFNFYGDDFESFKFNVDGTVSHYFCYGDFGFSDTEEGVYWFKYDFIGFNLPLSGYSYPPMVNYSDMSFTLRIDNRNHTYYKVLNVYNINVGQSIAIGNKDDVIKYVDGVFVEQEGNNIKGLKDGSGFVLVEDSKLKTTVAYRVNVNPVFEYIDFSKYLGKSKEEIQKEFGTPDFTDLSDREIIVRYENAVKSMLKYLSFHYGNYVVRSVVLFFDQYTDYQSYYSEISKKYFQNYNQSDIKERYFYDNEDRLKATIEIVTNDSFMTISIGKNNPIFRF